MKKLEIYICVKKAPALGTSPTAGVFCQAHTYDFEGIGVQRKSVIPDNQYILFRNFDCETYLKPCVLLKNDVSLGMRIVEIWRNI